MASNEWPYGPLLAQSEIAYANVLARANTRQAEIRSRDIAMIRRARAQRFAAIPVSKRAAGCRKPSAGKDVHNRRRRAPDAARDAKAPRYRMDAWRTVLF